MHTEVTPSLTLDKQTPFRKASSISIYASQPDSY